MKHVESISMKKRIGAIIAAGALAMSTMAAPMAFADAGVNSPTQMAPSAQDGTTDVYVQTIQQGESSISTENISFTIPNEVDFVAKADGTLLGPDCYLENESAFGIHINAMTTTFDTGWTPAAWSDVQAAENVQGTANLIDYKIGPKNDSDSTKTDQLDAYNHKVERSNAASNVGTPGLWKMEAAHTGSYVGDRVEMSSSGVVANVSKTIGTKTKVGEITWYVAPDGVTIS